MKISLLIFSFVFISCYGEDVTETATSQYSTLTCSDNNCTFQQTATVPITTVVKTTNKYDSKELKLLNTTTIKPDKNETDNSSSISAPTQSNRISKAQNITNNHTLSHYSNGQIKHHLKTCHCDTMKGSCDINCCCDDDCSLHDVDVFSHCADRRDDVFKSDYCFVSNVIYKNNTAYKSFDLRPGLLCIARDNLPDSVKYYTHGVITTESRMKRLLHKRRIYRWKENSLNIMNSSHSGQRGITDGRYKVGDSVWIVTKVSNRVSMEKLEIMEEGMNSLCESDIPVGYLESVETSCLKKLPSTSQQCQTYRAMLSLSDRYVVISPGVINKTYLFQQTELNKISRKIQFFACVSNICGKTNLSVLSEDSDNSCPVVEKIRYEIEHNGTEGIVSCNCYVYLTNLTYGSGYFRQKFSVEFKWSNESNSTFPRSGNPSYLLGKPLISGQRNESSHIIVSRDPDEWLSTFTSDQNGFCSDIRNNINFGYNTKSECIYIIKSKEVNESDNCGSVHQSLSHMFFSKSFNTSNTWISSWGDIKPDDTSSWIHLVPIFAPDQNLNVSCLRIITSILYTFVYTLTGPVSSPRVKLIGAAVQPTFSQFECKNTDCLVKLHSSVIFTTVESVPKLIYPKHPALRLHLPRDFFYPFSSSSGCDRCTRVMFAWSVFIGILSHLIC